MNESNHNTDPIPEEFKTLADAADFWDTHSLSDYWEETQEVEIGVRASRRQWVPLATHVASRALVQAQQEGVSLETLVNLWVAERLEIAG
ncbi:MAG TPA: hypothetical protein GYA08_25225 [Chloroflexi bacterium]|jgi:predicted HicB family RNase H-like nuclease|nr:hypothetical protein [Chloroflexota bacterium]